MEKQVETIWAEFGSNLKGFIVKRVGDEPEADDILQNVFFKIHTHLNSLQDDNKMQGWIYQITRNAIVDYYRQRENTLDLDEQLPQFVSADDEIKAALTQSVRAMVECLPDEYRTPLVLDAFEGMSQAEIATRLNLSYSAAKSRVQRARAKLRDLLFDCCHFEFDRRGGVIDYHPRENCCPQCGCGPNMTLMHI